MERSYEKAGIIGLSLTSFQSGSGCGHPIGVQLRASDRNRSLQSEGAAYVGNLRYVLNLWFAHSGAPLMGFRSGSGCEHPIEVRLRASDWGLVTGNPRNHSLRTPRPPYGLPIGSPKRAGMPHSEPYSGNGGGQERAREGKHTPPPPLPILSCHITIRKRCRRQCR